MLCVARGALPELRPVEAAVPDDDGAAVGALVNDLRALSHRLGGTGPLLSIVGENPPTTARRECCLDSAALLLCSAAQLLSLSTVDDVVL